MIRAFIAAPLPGAIRERIQALHSELKKIENRSVRWVRPEGIHLTFHFLGDIEEAGIESLGQMISAAGSGFKPFPVRVRGLGAFPGLKRPRVFWAGLEAGEEIQQLHLELKQGLKELRYPVESRKFRPHLTLGRVRSPGGISELIQKIESLSESDLGEFEVREIVLFRSELKPGGAVYTPLQCQILGQT